MAGLPQCRNGLDDDGDGLTDYGEVPGCASADDTTEATQRTLTVSRSGDGTASGTRIDCGATCSASYGGGPA